MSGITSTPGATALTEPVDRVADPDVVAERSTAAGAVDAAPSAAAPPAAGRRLGRRVRGRRVRSILKRVSPWSVFKVAVIFFACLYGVLLLAGVMVWRVAENGGLIENAETFIAKGFAMESFDIDGEAVFRAGALAGAVIAAAFAGLAMLFTVFFNIICDLTGGIRLAMVELDPPRKRNAAKASATMATTAGPVVTPIEPVVDADAGDEDATVIDLTDDAVFAPGADPELEGSADAEVAAETTDDRADADLVEDPATPTTAAGDEPAATVDVDDDAGGADADVAIAQAIDDEPAAEEANAEVAVAEDTSAEDASSDAAEPVAETVIESDEAEAVEDAELTAVADDEVIDLTDDATTASTGDADGDADASDQHADAPAEASGASVAAR